MNISIIIPNYNGENLLKKNLPKVYDAVRDYKDGKVEIIIPDDPSTDRSQDVIEEFISSIRSTDIVGKTISNKSKRKSGFGKNVNRGASIATGDVLILLNSDVYPHKSFLEPLLKHFEEADVFAVGCLDESIEEDGKVIYRGRGIGEFKKGFLNHNKGKIDGENTLWVSGGSGAFRKTLWDKLNGMDTIYDPFYWEDIDLSYQARKGGFRTLFEQKSVVTHEHETGVVKKQFSENYVKKISYRNQFIFVWKNITDNRLLLSHIVWLPYHFLKALIARDFLFYEGFYLALLKLPGIIVTRRFVKIRPVKTDLETITV
jgi:GT2 family glycosyltransferase